jgi:hypothetical protein
VLIANKSMDNDAGRHAAGGGDANISGRTLGGGSGLGLLGVVAAQSSRYVGTALGFGCVANTVFKLIAAGATSLKGL